MGICLSFAVKVNMKCQADYRGGRLGVTLNDRLVVDKSASSPPAFTSSLEICISWTLYSLCVPHRNYVLVLCMVVQKVVSRRNSPTCSLPVALVLICCAGRPFGI